MIQYDAAYNALPPCNMDAEQAVLGSILLSPVALDRAAAIISVDSFYRDIHRAIWEAAVALHERATADAVGAPIDLITLQSELESRGQFEQVGGFVYLAALMDAPSTAENVEHYAQLVEDKRLLRNILDASALMRTAVYHPDERTVPEIVEYAESLVRNISLERSTTSLQPLQAIVHERIDQLEARYENKGKTGQLTPFDDYNYLTQGLHSDELTLIAARPGMGKTSALLQLAVHHARHHGPAALFSMEMSAGQMVDRLICSESRVESHRVRTGYINAEEWQRIGQAACDLDKVNLHIDDTAAMSIHELRSKARRMHAASGLSLVCVDYLQLLAGTANKQNRVAEIGEVARGLKTLSRELHLPVIALAQLSRAVETRPDKRPILSDLRESGDLEASADVVIFLYRDAYYKHKSDEDEDDENADPFADPDFEKAQWIFAKHRNGPTGIMNTGWIGKYTRFEELTTRGLQATDDRRTPYADA